MFSDTQPASLDASGGPDPWSQFRVGHPQERKELLRQLRDRSVPVNLSAPDGSALTVLLWSADDDGIGFSVDPESPQLEGMLDGNEAVAMAYLDAPLCKPGQSVQIPVQGGKSLAATVVDHLGG